MLRLKLWAFYQLMAWSSLIRPIDGQEMIDLASQGRAERDKAYTIKAAFGMTRAAKRKDKGYG